MKGNNSRSVVTLRESLTGGSGRRGIALVLVLILAAFHPSALIAQSIPPGSNNRLQVSIVEGDNATLDAVHSARLTVEVRDGAAAPVRGANVTFIAPEA